MAKRWAAATGAFVIATGSAVIWAPTASAAEAKLFRTCAGTVAGETVKLRVTLHLREKADNDILGIDIRATDNSETGRFANSDVNLRQILLRVKDEGGAVVAKTKTQASPFAVDLADAGEEVGAVRIRGKFRTHDRTGFVACNFDFQGF